MTDRETPPRPPALDRRQVPALRRTCPRRRTIASLAAPDQPVLARHGGARAVHAGDGRARAVHVLHRPPSVRWVWVSDWRPDGDDKRQRRDAPRESAPRAADKGLPRRASDRRSAKRSPTRPTSLRGSRTLRRVSSRSAKAPHRRQEAPTSRDSRPQFRSVRRQDARLGQCSGMAPDWSSSEDRRRIRDSLVHAGVTFLAAPRSL